MQIADRGLDGPHQLGKIAIRCRFSGNEHVIVPGSAALIERLSGDFAQPPLGPVADHCIADFFGRRKADPNPLAAIRFDLHQNAWARRL